MKPEKKIKMRPYRSEDDYWRIREFLRQVFLLNDCKELNWHVARLDYWRWHGIMNLKEFPAIDEVIFIWETPDGQMAAVLNPEGKGEAFFQLHPGYRSHELVDQMLTIAEENLSIPGKDKKKMLVAWTNISDSLQQDILKRRGYTLLDEPESKEYLRRRSLDIPIPDLKIAAGYTIRAIGDVDEIPARSWASWRAFHPSAQAEDYEGWDWYLNIQQIPLYRRDLDIVAISPYEDVAAFCTVWFDDVTRSGYFEPVGTVPEHQRKDLGKAVMVEGLRRLKRLGGTLAFVGGYSQAANALYSSVAGPEYDISEPWIHREL